ncbi:four helix bundle protein [Candidatus Shapirobacteria bacterium CG10_big_fil_rev_8_21_14_0_10_40_9]|uniref:Four helix bundle protein n=1 Tax=Candidatus Shapirobacteria bacterium CG10_big_fil_rev_8_21_14_0_10_40_9 TaxID=1974888 RepID=A0A2M8L3E5_9BACT|nr:MAG: four helix bundle protein [Candidatus Shapirobacteria bacterium CG10_big_fil_rev_8_21_14_0_10_40_9]
MENGELKMEKKKDIIERAFKFGVAVIKTADSLPKTPVGFAIANQLVRSGTSVGANIEEAQDGLTRKEFIRSMSIALKEARETRFWLRIAVESGTLFTKKVGTVLNESEELIKILVTIVKKSKMKL